MKRTPLARGSSRLKRRTPLRRSRRSPEEFARIYGSLEFLFYVSVALLCPVCGREGPEWAHMKTGGKGRKADVEYGTVLCRDCHVFGPGAQHTVGWPEFKRRHPSVDFRLVGVRALEAFEGPSGQAFVALAKADGRFERWATRGGV
jgi:hypothetical protein